MGRPLGILLHGSQWWARGRGARPVRSDCRAMRTVQEELAGVADGGVSGVEGREEPWRSPGFRMMAW